MIAYKYDTRVTGKSEVVLQDSRLEPEQEVEVIVILRDKSSKEWEDLGLDSFQQEWSDPQNEGSFF